MTPPPEAVAFLADLGLPPDRIERLGELGSLYTDLLAANERTNLTRITGEEDFWILHVCDSLAVLGEVPVLATAPLAVADVGCGAGFPLLPVARACPALRIVGIESRRRKAEFVARQIERLGLDGASVEAERARDLARRDEHRQRYDFALARAVGPADRVARECRRLLRPDGGTLVLYKTPATAASERKAAAQAERREGVDVSFGKPFDLPLGRGRRQFVLLRRRL